MPTMYYVWQTNGHGGFIKYLGKMDQTGIANLRKIYAKVYGKNKDLYTEIVD